LEELGKLEEAKFLVHEYCKELSFAVEIFPEYQAVSEVRLRS
jgi:hypothetical protein